MCTEISRNCGELVFPVMIVSDACSNAEMFVNELFMQVVCRNTIVTIFTNALSLRNIDDIQTALFYIERGLGRPKYRSRQHRQQKQKSSQMQYLVHFI